MMFSSQSVLRGTSSHQNDSSQRPRLRLIELLYVIGLTVFQIFRAILLKPIGNARFLGIEIDGQLSFKKHVDSVVERSLRLLNVLRILAHNGTEPKTLIKLYKSYVRPILEYGSSAFIAAPKSQITRLQQIQNEAIRICLKLPKYIRTKLLHEYASLQPIDERILNVNKSLLKTMKTNNSHIESLIANHFHLLGNSHTSPLDIILNS